ncbi:MAG: sugar phosphate isomerase/epimerase family protein [Phycisphaeraceae bacterium]
MTHPYAVILGNLGNTKDRFCGGYKENPDTLTMLRQAAAIEHVQGIELVGTWDVTPANAKELAKVLTDLGKACASIIPDLFADKRYWKGSYSSPDAKVRRHAIDYTKQMCEVAQAMDCPLLNLWPGQDGYDYLLTANYQQQRDWFRDAVIECAEAFPDLRFALEYKPKEPRCRSYIATMADTLLMCMETGRENVGVCIDTGHAYVAQESVGEAVVLAKRAGNKLFHMHFNDNHGHWDDDMIVGTIHSTTYIETLYWLDRTGYAGWLSMDQYPYREDAATAIGESIQWLTRYDAIVQANREHIDKLVDSYDAVAASKFLRETTLGAGTSSKASVMA